MTKFFLPIAFLFFTVTNAFSQVGALDTDFGTSGLVTTDVPGNNDISSRVKVQDDGKIVLGGRCDEGPLPIMFLARYDTTGVIDSDFGIDGIALSDISYFTTFSDLFIQTDGKFLVLGNTIITPGQFDMALTRMNTDGSIDTDFGTDGSVFIDLGDTTNLGEAVIQLPDEKIVVLGHIGGGGTPQFSYTRFNADGSLDTDFGDGGHVITDVSAISTIITRAFRTPDGKIAVCGFGIKSGDYNDSFIAVFTEDGTLKPEFGTDGIQWVDISTSSFFSYDMLVQPDNKILFIGTYTDDITGDTNMKIIRLNDNGSYDTFFGDGGKVTIDFDGSNESGTSIDLQNDYSILIGGHSTINGDRDFVLMRLENNGDIDNLFGTDGKTITDFAGGDDKALDLIMQSDFKILQVGQVNDGGLRIGMARFFNNTIIETNINTLNPNSVSLFPNPASDKIYIAGLPANINGGSFQIMDITGRLIESVTITDNTGEIEINLPEYLNPGMYVIRIIKGDVFIVKNFIKQ